MSDVMQALQAYAQRQKNGVVDSQISGMPPMAAPAASGPTMPQAQFSGYPGTKPQMTPQQMQQLIMLLKTRGPQGVAQPQAPMASPQIPGMPPM